MAEFKPITTQDEFDAVIGPRLGRERETLTKQFEAEKAELNKKVTGYETEIAGLKNAAAEAAKKYEGYDQTLAELQGKVKKYETDSVKTRIAREVGLPFEMAGRLNGETEDELKADAEALYKLVSNGQRRAPGKSTENLDGANAAMRDLLRNLKGE